jgi:hypothetical protein
MFRALKQPSATPVDRSVEEFLSEAVVQVDVGLELENVLHVSATAWTTDARGSLNPGRPSTERVRCLDQAESVE